MIRAASARHLVRAVTCARCGGGVPSIGGTSTAGPAQGLHASRGSPHLNPNSASRRSISQMPRNRYGRVREGLAAQASPFEVDIKMDEVKEALNACGTVQQAWDWALVNIFGASKSENSAGAESPQLAPTSRAGAFVGSRSLPAYGIHTAFYAPAIHSLFLHFRDSLRSPHAALAVVDTFRARSAESLVLGSTPALYADVVKLHWSLRRDLVGVRDTVRMAKRIGILSTARGQTESADLDASGGMDGGHRPSIGRFRPRTSEDAVLRAQVEAALDEARREALTGVPPSSIREEEEEDEERLGWAGGRGSQSSSTHSRGRGEAGKPSRRDPQMSWTQLQQLAIADDIASLLDSNSARQRLGEGINAN